MDYAHISTLKYDKVTLKKYTFSWVLGDFQDLIALDPKNIDELDIRQKLICTTTCNSIAMHPLNPHLLLSIYLPQLIGIKVVAKGERI